MQQKYVIRKEKRHPFIVCAKGQKHSSFRERKDMYFFLSDDYVEPSILIKDPQVLQEELASIENEIALCEKQRERLRHTKEVLNELSVRAPKSLAKELLARIKGAESEYEALLLKYDERKEECKEALALLGMHFEGGRTH